jgi:hypothetical protein
MLLQMQNEYTQLAVLGKQKQNPTAICLHQLNIPFNNVTQKGGGGGNKKKKKVVIPVHTIKSHRGR